MKALEARIRRIEVASGVDWPDHVVLSAFPLGGADSEAQLLADAERDGRAMRTPAGIVILPPHPDTGGMGA